jgi:hypothetical protein
MATTNGLVEILDFGLAKGLHHLPLGLVVSGVLEGARG